MVPRALRLRPPVLSAAPSGGRLASRTAGIARASGRARDDDVDEGSEEASPSTSSSEPQHRRLPLDPDPTPVFRTTTIMAERRRRHDEDLEDGERKLRVLFVEEGGEQVRSGLALALFRRALRSEGRLRGRVEADCAAILPHCSYAWEDGVRAFDDVNDAVESDLIVVMDRFDHAEVLREVAAYDNIFPGGYYALKVRRLAGFRACTTGGCALRGLGGDNAGISAGHQSQDPHELDISDPLYASLAAATASPASGGGLDAVYHEVSESVAGLAHYLEQIAEIADHNGNALPTEVSGNLRVNDIAIGQEGAFARNTTLLRSLAARRQQSKQRGYWLDIENVERELSEWARRNARPEGIMPCLQDIKDSGDYMIFHAVTKYHGGKASVARRLGWSLEGSVGRGFWSRRENIREALGPYLDCQVREDGFEECTLPTKQSLIERGRQDLVGAIDRVGGFRTVAKDLNLKTRRSGRKALYPELQDWGAYRRRLELWMAEKDERALALGRMPRMKELWGSGALDLYYSTKKYHGGWKRVAERMGWGR